VFHDESWSTIVLNQEVGGRGEIRACNLIWCFWLYNLIITAIDCGSGCKVGSETSCIGKSENKVTECRLLPNGSANVI